MLYNLKITSVFKETKSKQIALTLISMWTTLHKACTWRHIFKRTQIVAMLMTQNTSALR
jgi:hypothetical protein